MISGIICLISLINDGYSCIATIILSSHVPAMNLRCWLCQTDVARRELLLKVLVMKDPTLTAVGPMKGSVLPEMKKTRNHWRIQAK